MLPKTYTIGVVAVTACAAQGQLIDLAKDTPDGDRWMYPFNGTPGTRALASTFSAADVGPGFDDRDAQYLLMFDTLGGITPGLDLSEYQIIGARVTVVIDNDEEFVYDPTPDSFRTLLDTEDAEFEADTDAGRAITIFGVGYRNGWDSSSWTETSAFGGIPDVEPAQGARNVFAANFDQGVAFDVSNNVKERFEVTPLGVGQIEGLAPGDPVAAESVVVFELDRCDEEGAAYIQRALRDGRLTLSISSMQAASGGPGGGTGDVLYPTYKTADNALAQILGQTPSLELSVRVGSPGNYDGEGIADFSDVLAFLTDFGSGSPRADLAPPCVLDFSDVLAFLIAFGEAVGG